MTSTTLRTDVELFYDNEYNAEREELATAEGGRWYNGYTTMDFNNLVEGIEGSNIIYDVVLKKLVGFKEELLKGDVVRVYVIADVDNYKGAINAKFKSVEVFNKDEYDENQK